MVESYWIGNTLLDRVAAAALGGSLGERFRHRLGSAWSRLLEVVPAGARPHHNFHVFAVYPWVGLLRSGHRDEPLRVLDRCRVRWGQVVSAVDHDRILVRSRPLDWNGFRLRLGTPRIEAVTASTDGRALTVASAGDWVALHWDWMCQPLSPRQMAALRHHTLRQLAVVNGVVHPPPTAVLA